MIRVDALEGPLDMGDFITVARRIYRADPRWVEQPEEQQRRRLDVTRAPFWRRAEREVLVAHAGSVRHAPVGRLVVFRDHLHEAQSGGEPLAFFGLFEASDDPEVAAALMERARAWARERGLRRLRGPISFTMLEEVGVLMEGFDRPPRLRTAYNPPYYAPLLEAAGLRVAREYGGYDWSSWDLPLPPAPLAQRALRAGEHGIRIEPFDPQHLDEAVRAFVAVYDDALRGSWGFTPLPFEEAAEIFESVANFGEPRLVWQASVDGDPAGFILALPDLNEALVRTRRGFGLFSLGKALYLKGGVRTLRVLSMAVRARYRRHNLAGHLVYRAWQAAMDAGIVMAEFSPVDLADEAMTRLLHRIGCRRTKRWAVFEDPAAPGDLDRLAVGR
ncbi:MAG: GNAT family N-acetyltransferase [Myxococcota bacterium]